MSSIVIIKDITGNAFKMQKQMMKLEDAKINIGKQFLKKILKETSFMRQDTFEIPYVITKNIKKYDAFIALGCVIKGETPHFDYICQDQQLMH